MSGRESHCCRLRPVPHPEVADTLASGIRIRAKWRHARTVGPPHLRDFAFEDNGSYLVGFNLFTSPTS
jgi:hypothetical protein